MTALTTDRDREFSRVLASRGVSMTFQPIVDLATREIVALEALARGPAGSGIESPAELFAAAHRCGRTAELDWVCRAAAFRAVLDAEIPPSMSLFVNAEPASLSTACPADLLGVVTQAEARLRVFVEVNDRALAADPAGLLAAVDRAREMSWGIAVDNVGSSRAPVAMLPVLHADAVKLNLVLLRKAEPEVSSAIVLAALRYVEETGAALCVERIENEDDLHWARAIGAVYGQGYHIAPPGPLADHYQHPRSAVRLVADSPGDALVSSPFGLLSGFPARRVEIPQFEEMAHTIAFGAVTPGASPIILIGIGDTPHDPTAAAKFPPLERPLIIVLFGVAVRSDPSEGILGIELSAGDPLASEQFLIVLSDKGTHALVGRKHPDGGLQIVITQDPEVVHGIARHLVRRIPAPGGDKMALRPPTGMAADEGDCADESSGAPADIPRDERPRGRGLFGRRG